MAALTSTTVTGNFSVSGVNNIAPPGTILTFASGTPPTGYIECDGALLSRTTYATLYAVIGTMYGAGNGSTTFAAPDMRGMFLRGWDHGRSIDANRVVGSLQLSTMIVGEIDSDNQLSGLAGGPHSSMSANWSADQIDPNAYPGTSFTQTPNGMAVYATRSYPTYVGGTRPINIAVMYCIKY